MMVARDIKISTVFFSVDVSKTLNTGINWTFKDSNATNGSVYGGQLKSNLVNPDQAASAASSGSSGGE